MTTTTDTTDATELLETLGLDPAVYGNLTVKNLRNGETCIDCSAFSPRVDGTVHEDGWVCSDCTGDRKRYPQRHALNKAERVCDFLLTALEVALSEVESAAGNGRDHECLEEPCGYCDNVRMIKKAINKAGGAK